MNIEGIISIVILAFSVSAISLTVTKAKVFEWLRVRLANVTFVGDLFKCAYCMSHWVSFALVAFYRPITIRSSVLVLDLLISAFMAVSLATMITWLVYTAYKKLDLENQQIQQLRQALEKAQQKLLEQDRLLKSRQT